MDFKHLQSEFISSAAENGKTVGRIAYYVYEPVKAEPRAIIQLSHGMCEYVRRYEHMAEYFCREGYVFCGNDHLGHGHSVADEDGLGFTALGGGVDFMVEDLRKMTELMRERFPGLPLILFGHSMGSFMTRLYITEYKDIAGAVISGTGGPDNPTGMGMSLAEKIMKKHGENYRSRYLEKIAFSGYNRRFGKNCLASAWISTDETVVNNYMNDPLCKYIFTARGFYDLFDALGRVSEKTWADRVPKELPLLLSAGSCDPVGAYGKGVTKVYERLIRGGAENVKLKLYEGARHELQNEDIKTREEFFLDVLEFVKECTEKK